jgi:pilus assembly protein CpaE
MTVHATTSSVPIAVIDGDEHDRQRLAAVLSNVGPSAFASLEAFQLSGARVPTVVVLGPSFADGPGLVRAEKFLGEHRDVAMVLVVDRLSTETLQQALRAGIRDVVAQDSDQLQEAISRVAAGLAASYVDGSSVDAGPVNHCQVITVFSTKGGSGKSVIASNLAMVLARQESGPVVLVDADLQFGDLAVMLKLTPHHTLVDAVGNIHRLDAQLLQSLLVPHSSGVRTLAAPLEPAFSDQVGASDIVTVLDTLRTFCRYVVVDTPAHFNEVVLALLEQSDDILLVAGMDIPSIKNVKLGLQTLRLLNVPSSKLKLVLNRANSKVRLDVAEVERTLQLKADCLIPSDIVVPQSVNKGVPAVLDAPKSRVAKSFEELAEVFVAADAERSGR